MQAVAGSSGQQQAAAGSSRQVLLMRCGMVPLMRCGTVLLMRCDMVPLMIKLNVRNDGKHTNKQMHASTHVACAHTLTHTLCPALFRRT